VQGACRLGKTKDFNDMIDTKLSMRNRSLPAQRSSEPLPLVTRGRAIPLGTVTDTGSIAGARLLEGFSSGLQYMSRSTSLGGAPWGAGGTVLNKCGSRSTAQHSRRWHEDGTALMMRHS
jgi:hypothetical protein